MSWALASLRRPGGNVPPTKSLPVAETPAASDLGTKKSTDAEPAVLPDRTTSKENVVEPLWPSSLKASNAVIENTDNFHLL